MSSIVIAATQTQLGAAGVFTGEWVRIPGVDDLDGSMSRVPFAHDKCRVVGYTYSDQPSAANGFAIQQSLDGSTVAFTTATTQAGDEYISFDVLVVGKYVRIVYTNAGTPQVSFDLFGRLVEES